MHVFFLQIYIQKNAEKKFVKLWITCEKYKLLCCLSGSFNEIELIDKKRFMCQKALEIAHEQEPDKRSFREEDYYVQIVCSCALPYIGHARYLERELTELASEDFRQILDNLHSLLLLFILFPQEYTN